MQEGTRKKGNGRQKVTSVHFHILQQHVIRPKSNYTKKLINTVNACQVKGEND